MDEKTKDLANDAIEKYLRWLIDLDVKREANAVSKINAACTAIHTAIDVLKIDNEIAEEFAKRLQKAMDQDFRCREWICKAGEEAE